MIDVGDTSSVNRSATSQKEKKRNRKRYDIARVQLAAGFPLSNGMISMQQTFVNTRIIEAMYTGGEVQKKNVTDEEYEYFSFT